MKTITISVKKRTELGKKNTRDLRKINHVPCVMYGGPEVIHFHAHENDFRHIVYTPDAYIIELDIDGQKHRAVLQDMQFHPLTDSLVHMDFVEVFEERPVTMEVPSGWWERPSGSRMGGSPARGGVF